MFGRLPPPPPPRHIVYVFPDYNIDCNSMRTRVVFPTFIVPHRARRLRIQTCMTHDVPMFAAEYYEQKLLHIIRKHNLCRHYISKASCTFKVHEHPRVGGPE